MALRLNFCDCLIVWFSCAVVGRLFMFRLDGC